MAIGYGVPVPKGKTRTQVKAKRDREDAKALRHFRDRVWDREAENGAGEANVYARCQHCGTLVTRGFLLTGEVHHRIPRSRCTPEQRTDPSNGVLLCNHLINNCHDKAQRGVIQV